MHFDQFESLVISKVQAETDTETTDPVTYVYWQKLWEYLDPDK